MKLSLAENIRTLRKQRALTQERLAEVLGVTTGAVYKWETGLSTPELPMIVEMADFFDVSVDALLGYEMKDNRLSAAVSRLDEYCRTREPGALAEAEKALKKYPNSFEIVYACANLYKVYAVGKQNRDKQRRALELFEQARVLLDQNDDPSIGDLTILGEMANVYAASGEAEKGMELLKKNNPSGIFSDTIGLMLALVLKRSEEAEPYLARALLLGASALINAVMGYAFVFRARGDYASAQEILLWGIEMLDGLKKNETVDFLDKIGAILNTVLAHILLKTGQKVQAREAIARVAAQAARFDAKPDYGVTTLRFAVVPESVGGYDGLGATARESVEEILRLLEDPALDALWKEAFLHG